MAKDDSGYAEIEEYSKKLNHNPESLVFVPLAEAYRKSGMLDEAIETCLKGLQLHPSYMSARMVLGRAYMEKSMYEEAATEFRKVASADVNNIMAHSLLAQIFLKQSKHTEAIKEFQKVLTLNPEDVGTQQMLSKALELARQQGSGADTNLASSQEQDKKKNLTRAEELSKQGDIDNAVKIYKLILDADPENLVVRQRLRDLEARKTQSPAGRKPPEKGKGDSGPGAHDGRDNDKITSDDILSVMKDTVPRMEKGKGDGKPEAKAAPRPEHPAPKAEVKSSAPAAGGASPDKLPGLDRLMQTEGIVGSMLLDIQGNILNSTFSNLNNPKDIAAAVAVIIGKTEKSIQVMDYGKQINQILITGEKGQIIFSKIGNKILLVLADENINLGKMRLAMNEVVRALRQ